MMIAALCCGVSCSEELNPEQIDNSNYITVTSQVDPHTKAGYEGTSVLPDIFYIHIDQSGTDMDYRLPLTREPNTSNYLATIQMKWKETTPEGVKVLTVPHGLTSVDMENTMAITINQEQSNSENLTASDLLGASTQIGGITINQNNIHVTFKHLMSKLQITYTKPTNIEVTSVVLKNTCVKGGYSFKNMNYDTSVEKDFGDITMFHEAGKSAAEAIFFPYTPASDPKLVVTATINGQSKAFECPIVLKSGSDSFVGGKRYVMSVTISETGVTGVMTMIKDWNTSNKNPLIEDEKILWIGTSIPAGSGYPQIVADNLKCQVINNAVGGSLVLKENNGNAVLGTKAEWDAYAAWLNGEGYSFKHLAAGGLAQTTEEAEIYRANLENRYDESGAPSEGKKTWVDEQIRKIASLSYQKLILPYITGSDPCTTIILDHGFNDLTKIVLEAGGHHDENNLDWGDYGDVWGYEYLMKVKNEYRGEEGYNQYYSEFLSNPNLTALGQPEDRCYIIGLSNIIKAIRSVNSDVKIIIGNYFTLSSPYSRYIQFPTFKENFTSLICYNNEAVAAMWNLDIVNVHEQLYIPDGDFWGGYTVKGYDEDNNEIRVVNIDETKFCHDGVHPTQAGGKVIADIYIRALRDILR